MATNNLPKPRSDGRELTIEIAARIRAARAYRNVGQAELSRALGWSKNSLSSIEKGGILTASRLILLASMLELPTSHFLPSTSELTSVGTGDKKAPP